MRARRIENEWLLLEALQRANPDRLRITRHPDAFTLEVDGFPALLDQPRDSAQSILLANHHLRLIFPRYYPSMPTEVYLAAPVFHPNVHPDTGFVCLWTRHHIQTTVEQTLAQLQRVLSWQLLNTDPEHVMQPDALHWYQQPERGHRLPLVSAPLLPVNANAWAIPSSTFRRRLS
jgi:ubiquitin-protein ligase